MEHCCEAMDQALQDPRVVLIYRPYERGYYLPRKYEGALDGLVYCFWCGVKLPDNLYDLWFDLVFNQLKVPLSDDYPALETPGLPDEFKTDEWWKERGL